MNTVFGKLTGKAVFIRTVTSYFTGALEGITDDGFLELQDAAWIAVTSRFGTMLAEGISGGDVEIEPYPANLAVFINLNAVVDISEWKHALPREQT